MLLKHSIGVLRPLWLLPPRRRATKHLPWVPHPGDAVIKIVEHGFHAGLFGVIVGVENVEVGGHDVVFAYVLWSDEYVEEYNEQEYVHDYYLRVKG